MPFDKWPTKSASRTINVTDPNDINFEFHVLMMTGGLYLQGFFLTNVLTANGTNCFNSDGPENFTLCIKVDININYASTVLNSQSFSLPNESSNLADYTETMSQINFDTSSQSSMLSQAYTTVSTAASTVFSSTALTNISTEVPSTISKDVSSTISLSTDTTAKITRTFELTTAAAIQTSSSFSEFSTQITVTYSSEKGLKNVSTVILAVSISILAIAIALLLLILLYYRIQYHHANLSLLQSLNNRSYQYKIRDSYRSSSAEVLIDDAHEANAIKENKNQLSNNFIHL